MSPKQDLALQLILQQHKTACVCSCNYPDTIPSLIYLPHIYLSETFLWHGTKIMWPHTQKKKLLQLFEASFKWQNKQILHFNIH